MQRDRVHFEGEEWRHEPDGPAPEAPPKREGPDLAAYRAAREKSFTRWLEAHHDKIVKLAGFLRLDWPRDDHGAELAVHMVTKEAAHAVLELFREARSQGVHVDPDRFEILREEGQTVAGTDHAYVVEPRVEGAEEGR